MNYALNSMQQHVLNEACAAEIRTQEQMLSLLLAEAMRFYFLDHEAPRGNPDSTKLETQLINDARAQV
jgi:hypothetical protein